MNRIDMNIDLYEVSIKYPKLNHDSIIFTAKLKKSLLEYEGMRPNSDFSLDIYFLNYRKYIFTHARAHAHAHTHTLGMVQCKMK